MRSGAVSLTKFDVALDTDETRKLFNVLKLTNEALKDRAWKSIEKLGYQPYSGKEKGMMISLLERKNISLVRIQAHFEQDFKPEEVDIEVPLPMFELFVLAQAAPRVD